MRFERLLLLLMLLLKRWRLLLCLLQGWRLLIHLLRLLLSGRHAPPLRRTAGVARVGGIVPPQRLPGAVVRTLLCVPFGNVRSASGAVAPNGFSVRGRLRGVGVGASRAVPLVGGKSGLPFRFVLCLLGQYGFSFLKGSWNIGAAVLGVVRRALILAAELVLGMRLRFRIQLWFDPLASVVVQRGARGSDSGQVIARPFFFFRQCLCVVVGDAAGSIPRGGPVGRTIVVVLSRRRIQMLGPTRREGLIWGRRVRRRIRG